MAPAVQWRSRSDAMERALLDKTQRLHATEERALETKAAMRRLQAELRYWRLRSTGRGVEAKPQRAP
jgi:hypothetical protein